MNHTRHAALWALLAAMASSGCSSAIASHPSFAFAAPRADAPNGAPVCAVAGATSTIARKVMVTSGVEAMSTKEGIALGFATNAKQGVALRLDPSTMETTLLGTDAATSAIQRVVPVASEEGRITLDTDCPSHRVGGARTVVCHAPFVVGAEGGSIVWATSASDEPRGLWQVEATFPTRGGTSSAARTPA